MGSGMNRAVAPGRSWHGFPRAEISISDS